MITKKFHVDFEKRQCICVLVANLGFTRKTFIGKARCSLNDVFNPAQGKEIAYVRALIKLKSEEIALHKEVMSLQENLYKSYLKHQSSVEFNQKRLKELKEELVELTE
jgi:hypothetical protein